MLKARDLAVQVFQDARNERRKAERDRVYSQMEEARDGFAKAFPDIPFEIYESGMEIYIESGDLKMRYTHGNPATWVLCGACLRCGEAIESTCFSEPEKLGEILSRKKAWNREHWPNCTPGAIVSHKVKSLLGLE